MENPNMPKMYNVCEYLMSAREKRVYLPEGVDFDGANFSRLAEDLVVTSRSGNRVFIRGFFAQKKYPLLVSGNKEQMHGDLAAAFVKLSPLAVEALLEIDSEIEGIA